MAFLGRCIRSIARTSKCLPITAHSHKIHRWVAPTLKELKRRENKQGGKLINHRNAFLEWNLEAEIYAFGSRLHEDFDQELLLQAFTDRSYVVKERLRQKEIGFDLQMKDNKELAEEGEKFIKSYIRAYLEHVLPRFPQEGIEGVLQHLTSEELLAHVSLNLGTKDIILADQYPVDSSTLAKTLKAVVGALIKSSGEERSAHFVRDLVITQLNGKDVNDYHNIEDPYKMLTDLLAKENSTVEPRLIGEVGANTLLACFRVGLYVDKKMISSGFGESIAEAKEMASRQALKKIFGTQDHMPPIDFTLQGMPKKTENRQISSS